MNDYGMKIYCISDFNKPKVKAKKSKFSIIKDLKLNGIFYLKCLFITSLLLLIMRGFIGI